MTMNNKTIVILLLIVAFAAGFLVGPMLETDSGDASAPGGETAGEPEILYWVAPMDPNYRRDGPGKSPMGMDLVPVYADDADSGDAVSISPAIENSLGVRTARAQVRPLWRRIEATGYVGYDETRISDINTRVSGWIVNLPVDAEGERVSKGDLLFEFYSPELLNAQKEYLTARRRGMGPLLQGAREKLRALGMIPAQIETLERKGTVSENIRIVAPQNGVVTSLNVREGMYIQPNTTIMSLADLSSVWLQAEVFESQADWVAEGQSARATLDYMPGTEFNGAVDYVYPVLDPATRTLRVRLAFDNPDGRLKPNMYARVTIYGRLKPNALTIPRSALIPTPGNDRVVLALGDGKFHVQEVMTGLESGEFVEILAGIREGDAVVTSAQFLIDSEASIAGSIRRLESVRLDTDRRPLDRVYVSGWVDDVDRESRRVRVRHGPIDELGWPAMTMVFDTVPGLDLSRISAGQDVRIGLLQQPSGEYILEHIYPGSASTDDMTEVLPGQFDADDEAKRRLVSNARRQVAAMGTVRGIDAHDHVITVAHGPIAELDWPGMTMNFDVDPGVSLGNLGPGAEIHFTMHETEGGIWVIDAIHVMPAEQTTEHGAHDHD
jgi:Cu(I)/Ag(I) efflux system membrane fusion protein